MKQHNDTKPSYLFVGLLGGLLVEESELHELLDEVCLTLCSQAPKLRGSKGPNSVPASFILSLEEITPPLALGASSSP
jgi:hypothetical protein